MCTNPPSRAKVPLAKRRHVCDVTVGYHYRESKKAKSGSKHLRHGLILRYQVVWPSPQPG